MCTKTENEHFQYFLTEWLSHIQPYIKESSYNKYINLATRHITPHMGQMNIRDINRSFMQTYLACLSTGTNSQPPLSVKTIRDILSLIKRTLRYAGESDTESAPYFDRLLPYVKATTPDILNADEYRILTKRLATPESESEIGILLAVFTGIRIGELCALKWSSIHLAEGFLVVDSTLQRIQDKSIHAASRTKIIITKPKSECSIRTIPLPNFLVLYLQKFQKINGEYVLTGRADKYMEPRTLENRFKRLLQSLGLKENHFHTLRHTFATKCVEAGFDLKSLSAILGHSSVNITLNRYVHPSDELKKQNMEKLASLFPA